MAKFTKQNKAFDFCGYKIAYCPVDKCWIAFDWDYETDYRAIGPNHSSKNKAMDWCSRQLS